MSIHARLRRSRLLCKSPVECLFSQVLIGNKPGCMSCLTAWYTRKELAFRTALLYCGSLVSGAFSGLIAAGITADLDGKLGIAAWRWLFIVEV